VGNSLDASVKMSGDPKLLVKLSTEVNSQEAHAIDIKYHKSCWAKNVTGVLCKSSTNNSLRLEKASKIAAKIKFLMLTEVALNSSQILKMAQLEDAYECICHENNVKSGSISQKSIKELIQREILSAEFHKQSQVNTPEVVSVKQSRDNAIHLSESLKENASSEMKTLYDAALILRRTINRIEPWVFSGSL